MTLSTKSLENLIGVDIRLADVAILAQKILTQKFPNRSFRVTEGLRNIYRQEILFRSGKSKTMRSPHIFGRAIDIAAEINGIVTWDGTYYQLINWAFKEAAKQLNVAITWGGEWPQFQDLVHFQLQHYPTTTPADTYHRQTLEV